jgi:arylsulfatase A-like enzyme
MQGGGAGGPRPSIVLVTFDTLRADRLGCYGYDRWGTSISPTVDALAAQGVVFETCWAPRGQTRPSLSSMISGKYPITTGLRENRLTLLESHRTAFEYLQEAGYDVGIFLANFDTDRPAGRWAYRGAATAFSGKRDDDPDSAAAERLWDERTEAAALQWIGRLDATRPFALWVHFFDIHDPYNPAPGFDLYGHDDSVSPALLAPDDTSGAALTELLADITLGRHDPTPQELARIHGLYDGGVTATDARLARLLDALSARGLREGATILFSADHGEEQSDHQRYFFHDSSVYPGTLRIPLVMVGPGLPAGERRAAQVQILDVAATLLDLAGLPTPADMEARSLLPLARGATSEPTRPFAFIEIQDFLYAVTDGRWMYVHNPRHAQLRKAPFMGTGKLFAMRCFEGYDLQADPLAQHDLLAGLEPATLGDDAALPEPLRPLRAALQRWLADPRHERTMSWPGLGPEALPELLQLGYVGGDAERQDVLFGEDCAPRR